MHERKLHNMIIIPIEENPDEWYQTADGIFYGVDDPDGEDLSYRIEPPNIKSTIIEYYGRLCWQFPE